MHASDISLKVEHFTLDNAENNGTMMRSLEMMLGDHDIMFDAVDCRIMCFAHIVDLNSEQVTCNANDMVDSNGDNFPKSKDETATSGPITCGCNVVQVIRGLGVR